jgi:phage terminase small subunit
MAGNSRSGRRPDPTKAQAPKAEGEPVRPDFEDAEASALWDATVPWLVEKGIAGKSDSAALQAMCEAWGLYRKSYEKALAKPWDKDYRIAAISYLSQFETWASRFGLTPADRARLLTDPKPVSGSERTRFFKTVG